MSRYYAIAIFLYIFFRFVSPLSISRLAKWLLGLAVLVVSQQLLIMRVFFGSVFSPELPSSVLIGVGWLYMGLFFLVVILLARDLLLLGRLLARKMGFSLVARPLSVWGASALLGLALMMSGYALWQGVRVPEPRTVEIVLPNLPKKLDGLTIAHLTDLHASPMLRGSRTAAVVEILNAMQADLILLTGDLVDGSPQHRAADIAPLKNLRATYGVFAVPGNHEYYSDYTVWAPAFATLGLTVLENSHAVINLPGGSVVLAGVTDPVAKNYDLLEPDITKALAGAPGNTFTILLDHRPVNAVANAAAGADIQLSGHTHGGLVRGLDKIIALFNKGFVAGLYPVGDMRLYVSHGAGLWNGFPARLGVPSEVTRIILRHSDMATKK